MGEILEEGDKDNGEKTEGGEGEDVAEKTSGEKREGLSDDGAAVKEVLQNLCPIITIVLDLCRLGPIEKDKRKMKCHQNSYGIFLSGYFFPTAVIKKLCMQALCHHMCEYLLTSIYSVAPLSLILQIREVDIKVTLN